MDLFLLLFLPLSTLAQPHLSPDTLSLLHFKNCISSDPTGAVLSTWNPLSSPLSWHGLSFDNSGQVTALSLVRLRLSGELKFNSIAPLRALQNLSLSGNYFTGRLVPLIGTMLSLQVLDLAHNRFYGPIPAKISNLSGLVRLNLSLNGFSGGFPVGIRNLQQLRVIDLRSNALWGGVGELLSELRNAEYVDLSGNGFYGALGNLSGLGDSVKYLNLSCNRLSGRFFSNDSMRLFRNLEVLDLGRNRLTGELPSFGFLSNLKVLRVGDNLLYGPLAEDLFGSSMQLMEVDLSRNGFTGE